MPAVDRMQKGPFGLMTHFVKQCAPRQGEPVQDWNALVDAARAGDPDAVFAMNPGADCFQDVHEDQGFLAGGAVTLNVGIHREGTLNEESVARVRQVAARPAAVRAGQVDPPDHRRLLEREPNQGG